MIAERLPLGNIAKSTLTENIAQSRKGVKAFKEKNKISYSYSGVKELEQQLRDLEKQNRRLEGQMKLSGGARTDRAEVQKTARELVKGLSSK